MVINRMDVIISSRYAALVMHVGLHALLATNYMKYLPRYNGEGDVTVEEHLVAFYNFAVVSPRPSPVTDHDIYNEL
jgi:hypothetical protein